MTDVTRSGAQTLVVKSDQDVSTVDVKKLSDARIARCCRVNGDARGVTGWRECR